MSFWKFLKYGESKTNHAFTIDNTKFGSKKTFTICGFVAECWEQMKIAVELSKKDSFRGGAAISSPNSDFKAMEVRDTQTNISGRRDRGLARENPDGPKEFADEELNLKEMTDSERLAYAMKQSYQQSQSSPAVDVK